jgi:hypothetical protein
MKQRILKFFFLIQNIMMYFGMYLRYYKTPEPIVLKSIKKLLTCKNDTSQLVRLGPLDEDGGYYLPKHFKAKYCISPGVGPTSEFEQELEIKYDVPSLMLDASVKKPRQDLLKSIFIKKFLGTRNDIETINLKSAIKCAEENFGACDNNILQMDIEGNEFLILCAEADLVRQKFEVLVLELHFVDMIVFPHLCNLYESILKKLNDDYTLVHSHINTCCGSFNISKLSFGRVYELTFVRNE